MRAAEHRPIASDLPGYGDELLRPGPLSYVEHVSALLDGPATVVGCSLGGRIALELAVERPELVERLVLVNAALPGWTWSPEVQGSDDVPDMTEIAAILAAGIPDTRTETIEGAGHLPSLERPDELNRLLLDFLR